MATCTSCAVEVRRVVLEYRERVDVRRRRVGFTSPRTRLLVAVNAMDTNMKCPPDKPLADSEHMV